MKRFFFYFYTICFSFTAWGNTFETIRWPSASYVIDHRPNDESLKIEVNGQAEILMDGRTINVKNINSENISGPDLANPKNRELLVLTENGVVLITESRRSYTFDILQPQDQGTFLKKVSSSFGEFYVISISSKRSNRSFLVKDGSLLEFNYYIPQQDQIKLMKDEIYVGNSDTPIAKLENMRMATRIIQIWQDNKKIQNQQIQSQSSVGTRPPVAQVENKPPGPSISPSDPAPLTSLLKDPQAQVTGTGQVSSPTAATHPLMDALAQLLIKNNSGDASTATPNDQNKNEEIDEKTKLGIEIAHAAGRFHPSDLDLLVPDEKKEKKQVWHIVKQYIDDLDVKYKDKEYHPDEASDIVDKRIMRTFLNRVIGSVTYFGPAGSGKTETVERMVARRKAGATPSRFQKMAFLELNTAALAAGASYSGDIEARVNAIVLMIEAMAEKGTKVVLVVDEAHTLKGLGVSDGKPVDVTQYFKPLMARGKLSMWAISTHHEFYEAFSGDPAFLQRFVEIFKIPPSGEELYRILVKTGQKFNVKLSLAVAEKIAYFSDILDAVGAQPRRGIKLVDNVLSFLEQKQTTINEIDVNDLYAYISEAYKIDPTQFDIDKAGDVIDALEHLLEKRIVGHKDSLENLILSHARVLTGLEDNTKAMHRLFLIGDEGNGKAEMIRTLSESIGRHFLEINMVKYQNANDLEIFKKDIFEHISSKGTLITLYFRKIEEAHPEVQRQIAKMMREGTLIVNLESGSIDLSLKNISIILSSNDGASYLEKIKESRGSYDEFHMKKQMKAVVPEIMEEVHMIPVFPLTQEEYNEIVSRQVDKIIEEIMKRFTQQNGKKIQINLANKDKIVAWMRIKLSNQLNARKSWEFLTREIINQLSMSVVRNPNKTEFEIDIQESKFTLRPSKAPTIHHENHETPEIRKAKK